VRLAEVARKAAAKRFVYMSSSSVCGVAEGGDVTEASPVNPQTAYAVCKVSFRTSGTDNRSYRVTFEKIRKHLPGFKCAWDARRGAKRLYELFKRIDMTAEVLEYRTFTRLEQLEYLIRTQQIDESFFWREVPG
jgi:hypothetical protein